MKKNNKINNKRFKKKTFRKDEINENNLIYKIYINKKS